MGDVNQSIYRFRHANPDGIQTYNVRHPTTHDEVLNECRRCPTRVVAIADHLIRHNHPGVGGARLQPRQANAAGNIHIVQWDSVEEEATGLGNYVKMLVDGGMSPGEILILTPRRLLGYAIRDQIESHEIPVHSFYHEEALEDAQAQRSFALLSLLANPEAGSLFVGGLVMAATLVGESTTNICDNIASNRIYRQRTPSIGVLLAILSWMRWTNLSKNIVS